jgi:nitroreductase
MEKPALTEYPVLDLIRRRWSPRAFDAKPVPDAILHSLFEAARWAASSANEQPWSYVMGVKSEDPAQFDRLAGTLAPGNAWAKDAPVLALSLAKTRFSKGGAPNRVALHDVGLATAELTLQAFSEGIFVHQMAGFDVEKAREFFAIPEGYEPVAMIAIGYPGDAEKLDETLRKREFAERTRKRTDEFVFRGKWGSGGF